MSDPPPPAPEPGRGMGPGATPGTRTSRRRQRLIVLTGSVVGVILAVTFGVLAGGDDDEASGTAVEPWNAIVATHPESGELTIHDVAGEEIQTIDTGFDSATHRGVRGRFALVSNAGDTEAAIIDTSSGEITWQGQPSFDGSRIMWLPSSPDAPIAIDASPQGGEAIIIDAANGDEIDVADVAGLDDPLIVPHDILSVPGTPWFGVRDLRARQTAIVGFDSDPTIIDGLPLAVDHNQLLVGHGDDGQSQLSFAPVDNPADADEGPTVPAVRGAQLVGDEAVVLTDDGQLLRASPGAQEAAEVATIELGGEIAFAIGLSGTERFILSVRADDEEEDDTDQTVIVDTDGNEVARVDGQSLPAATSAATRCVAVRNDDTNRVIDIETGEEIGSASADGRLPPVASHDGCTIVVSGVDGDSGRGSTVVGASGEIELDGPSATIAPDGSAAIVRSDEAAIEDEPSIEVVDLADPGADRVVIDAAQAAFVTR